MMTTVTNPIVCGPDFSESAAQAALVADASARCQNAPLILEEEVLWAAPEHGVAQFAGKVGARPVVVGASRTGSPLAARWLSS